MAEHEIGLPIFELQERPIAMSAAIQYSRAIQNGDTTFIRPVFTSGPMTQSLNTRIKDAEREFSYLNHHTLTVTVPHTFGLYPADDVLENYYRQHGQHALIPAGFILAAEVKVIHHQDSRLPQIRPHHIWQGIKRYHGAKGRLLDIGARQFVKDNETGMWTFLDIEPRLSQ